MPPASPKSGAGAAVTGGGAGVASSGRRQRRRLRHGRGRRLLALPRQAAGDGHRDEREPHRDPRQHARLRPRLDARGRAGNGGGVWIRRVAPGRIVAPALVHASLGGAHSRSRPRTQCGAVGRRPGGGLPWRRLRTRRTPRAAASARGARCPPAPRARSATRCMRRRFQPLAQVHGEVVRALVAGGGVLGERLLEHRHDSVIGALRDQDPSSPPRG